MVIEMRLRDIAVTAAAVVIMGALFPIGLLGDD